MSAILEIPFSQGYVSTGDNATSAYDLKLGELAQMKGAFYRKNDAAQIWKMPGRVEFGSAGTGAIKGIAICQFDAGGTDQLVVSIGTDLVIATPGSSGTFATLVSGLDANATELTACHQDDRWFIGNGFDANYVLMPDGTIRLMGLQPPSAAPTAVASSQALVTNRPTASTGDFTGGLYAYDALESTFAEGNLPRSAAETATQTHTWTTFASGTEPNRQLTIKFDMSYTGAATSASDLVIEVCENVDGTTFNAPIWRVPFTSSPSGMQTLTLPVTVNGNIIKVRFTITAHLVDPDFPIIDFNSKVKVREIYTTGGGTANFSTDLGGFYYLTTEYNADELLEGPPQAIEDVSELVTMATQSLVVVTRPAIVNAAATHWNLYRTVDGAAKTYENFGFLAQTPIGTTTYTDIFDPDINTQLTPIVPLFTVGDLSFPRDTPPPPFFSMMSWRGSICGISRAFPRSWFYSVPGYPESFTAVYVIEQFPVDDHDVLVGQMAIGDTAVLLCQGVILAIDDLPTVAGDQYTSPTVKSLDGHPGCVGSYAYTSYSVAGEPRGAWVSPYGVYITNGSTCQCISTSLAWENEVRVPFLGTSVLRWDAKNLILWFEFDLDGDGANDHEMPFHMAPAHDRGGIPKIGQPTPKATSCMASALISSAHYRFSGHPADGSVYVEEVGSIDESTGENVSMTLQTGKAPKRQETIEFIKTTVIHGDFGRDETATLTTEAFRDSARSSSVRTNTVSLYNNRGTTVFTGRAGEAVQYTLDYDGPGLGGILGLQVEVKVQGRAGSAPTWASSSVTP